MESVSITIEKIQDRKKVTFQHENGSMELSLNGEDIDMLLDYTRHSRKWIIFKADDKQVSINLDNVLFWMVEEE